MFLLAWSGCAGTNDFRQNAQSPQAQAKAARAEAVKEARESFQEAKTSGGELAAPYDYYMAQEYLRLAEHELGEACVKSVHEFARKSKAHSAKAIEVAKGGVN